MVTIGKKKLWLIALLILLIAAGAWAGYTIVHAHTPVRIGVLLPITGSVEVKEPLEWAKDNINRQGGIGGRPVELVYKDCNTGNTLQMAEEFLADDSIHIVIGPDRSDDVYTLAPAFIEKQKILISPLATAGDISRAFEKNGYFWRTTQGDVAQVKVIVTLLKEKGVHRVALLSENTTYGQTFYDWSGFFAKEYGLDLVSIQQFEPDNSKALDYDVAAALKEDPEYIVAACGALDAATIKRAIDRSGKPVKLFLADYSVSPALISSLGPAAEGLEGTSPTSDPLTGFSVAYHEKFGHAPTDYAAPVYDALLLAAYTTARQDAVPFESPADSIKNVIYGNGTPKGWDAQAVRETLLAIRSGDLPGISGASGPLDYDTEFGVDPLTTYYSHWVIEDGNFWTIRILGSAKPGTGGAPVDRSRASDSYLSQVSSVTQTNGFGPIKKDFRAVIVGPSRTWSNYRHEADALTMYTLLRNNGVDDDHIILMLYDDIPTSPENPIKGDVHNQPKGPNIRSGAGVDYSGSQVTTTTFREVLTGTTTDSTPVVLDGNASTDLFVYIASHGTPRGIVFSGKDIFTPADFTQVTDTMSHARKYRQMVFMVDTCFGESIAVNATAPGILYLTGASSSEPSLGAVYDMDIKQWLSDEFTHDTLSIIQANPAITFRELYPAVYERVTGSHVQLITTGNVSTLDVPVREFLRP